MGAACSIEESSGPQNLRVPMVLKASKYAGPKGDVPKIFKFVSTPATPVLMHSLQIIMESPLKSKIPKLHSVNERKPK